jgi:hypothetical protein
VPASCVRRWPARSARKRDWVVCASASLVSARSLSAATRFSAAVARSRSLAVRSLSAATRFSAAVARSVH